MTTRREVTDTYYEWAVESYDGEDIINIDHSDKLPTTPLQYNEKLVLVRNVGVGIAGEPDSFDLSERAWAYVEGGKLPAEFDDGAAVPKRFHKEIK